MAELTFGPSLNKQQVAYATEVAEMARKIGVPPVLALGIAFKESSLDPNVKDSTAGAIGGMQVMPVHAKTFNITIEQLRDPKINLEIGLKLLKENLDRTKDKDHPNGNWPMSAALYNAGDKLLTNANIAKNGLPAETEDYIKKLKEYGVFKTAASAPAEDYAGEAPAEASAETPAEGEDNYGEFERKLAQRLEDTKPDRDIIREANERTQAQIVGAGTGTAISVARAAPAAVKNSARMLEEGRLAAQADAEALRLARATGTAGNVAGAAGAAGSAAGATGGTGPLSTAAAGNGRRPPGRGAGLFNYGIDAGLTDIEAARALDMTKQEGGAHDLLTQRREATNQVNRVAPNQFVENPRFGGLMTPTNVGGGGPRESFRMIPEVPPSPEVPGGQPAAMRPMPVAAPISTAPPKPGGLEYVRDLFTDLMDSKVGKGVGTFMRYAGPPAAVAGALGEGMNIKQQMDRPNEQRDYGDMALSGLGILAGGAALAASPFVAVPAGLTAAGIGGYRYFRDRAAAERANKRMTGSSMR
jgi:soluble lytic murein transglycosylase-like protein